VGYSKVRHKDNDLPAENATSGYLFRVKAAIPLLVGLLVCPGSRYATSVVALIDRTIKRLVIAADCRVDRDSGSTSACEIINEPDCMVAIAGLNAEKSSSFELRALVRRACNDPGNLRQASRSDSPASRAID
jgi:hypothetical protein